MRIQRKVIITVTSLLICGCVLLFAVTHPSLKTQWGGQGDVKISPKVVKPGETVNITYSILNSRGTAAGVKYVVISPGNWTVVRHDSFSLRNGSGSKTVKIKAGGDIGGYLVICYWYIRGYGVDGPTCLAYDTFNVR